VSSLGHLTIKFSSYYGSVHYLTMCLETHSHLKGSAVNVTQAS
jgi:hypothetical protein